MARLFEYQGKEIFQKNGIPVPAGQVVTDISEFAKGIEKVKLPLMLKSQILSGKRGKAGLIRSASTRSEAEAAFRDLWKRKLENGTIDKILLEEKLLIERELYVGVTADPSRRQPVIIVSLSGGMSVEEEAAIRKLQVNILKGVSREEIEKFLGGFCDQMLLSGLADVIHKLYGIYRKLDCRMIEINPLVYTGSGFIAADARVDIDDDSIFRQKELGIEFVEATGAREPTDLEWAAAKIDDGDHRGSVHFVQIDPDGAIARSKNMVSIGFDCVGAGTSLTTLDELTAFNYFPMNFADTSGNPTGSKMYRITKIILSQPGIEGYLFVSCMSSQQLDNTARGIIAALKELYPKTNGKPNIPMLLAFRGAWDEVAIKLFADHGISDSPNVRLLGRNSTELEAAQLFDALYKSWKRRD